MAMCMSELDDDCIQSHSQWDLDNPNFQEQQDEVMALESIYGDNGQIRVISKPAENGEGRFCLEVYVEVPLPEAGMILEVWIPYKQYEAPPVVKAAPVVAANVRPQFNRSESGRQWHSAFRVHHLPPLTLLVTLPHEYPSDRPPLFTLSSLWLDASQLSVLCGQIDRHWVEDGCGSPIIYTWVDWLQNSSLSFLSLTKTVVLTPYLEEDDALLGLRDPRALPECFDVVKDLVRLIEFDYHQVWTTFLKGEHECGVCFCMYSGNQFYVLHECGHRCCQECITEYCQMHVAEGTVQHLKCPEANCKMSIPPGIVRTVLGDTAYNRWERLCLQKALETMDDITWCPRCNAAVIRDADETQASCTGCLYSFCPRCAEPFHMKSPCLSIDEQIANLERETKKYVYDTNRWMIADDKRRDRVEHEEKLRKFNNEFLTKCYLKKETQTCPKCKIPIDKNGG